MKTMNESGFSSLDNAWQGFYSRTGTLPEVEIITFSGVPFSSVS